MSEQVGVLRGIRDKLKIRMFVEDYVLSHPNPFFQPIFKHDHPDSEVEAAVKSMRETSAFVPGQYFPPEKVAAVKAALDDAIAGNRPDLTIRTKESTGITRVVHPLMLCPEVLEMATDPFLCSVVEHYFRRRIYLADLDMRHVPPMSMDELDEKEGRVGVVGYTSSHWHRDTRGKQVKIMVYLTDVTEDDSCFSFLPGTDKWHNPRKRTLEGSRFTDEYVDSLGMETIEATGPAGTTLVFNTNPIHRLRRKEGAAVRQSLMLYYTFGQELRNPKVDPKAYAALSDEAKTLFRGNRPDMEE